MSKKQNNNLFLLGGAALAGFLLWRAAQNGELPQVFGGGGGGSRGFGSFIVADNPVTDDAALAENRQGDFMSSGTLTGVQDIDAAFFAAPSGSISGVEIRRTSSGNVAVFDTQGGTSPYESTAVAAQGSTTVIWRDAATGQITGATSPEYSASFDERGAQALYDGKSPLMSTAPVMNYSPAQPQLWSPAPRLNWQY